MNFKGKKNEAGFSLIELMIVVGIIGILATLAMPRFRQFQARAKMGEAKNNLTHIYTLEESYHIDQNRYLTFQRYGRMDNGRNNCAPDAGAQQLGFEISPCTANGPTPRYGYAVTAGNTAAFTAEARTGGGANNLVCPGTPVHGFSMNQDRQFSDRLMGQSASVLCAQ